MRTLAALICLVSPVYAQISIDTNIEVGQPIIARALDEVPTGSISAFHWLVPGGSVVLLESGRVAHIWARAGKHPIELIAAISDGKTISLNRYQDTFTYGPAPDPGTLAELVEPADAVTLAEFHDDWSSSVASGKVDTRAIFDAAYVSTRDSLNIDAAEAYVIIDARLAAIEGVDSKLAGELEAIAYEFGFNPDPQPIDKGPRVALLVRETFDSTPRMAGELVKLRHGKDADYLKDNRHQLAIIDDDSVDGDGRPAPLLERYADEIASVGGSPCLIIIDAKTEKVLNVTKLEKEFTASSVIQRIKDSGG